MAWYVYANDPALEVYASESEYTVAGFACYGEYSTQEQANARVDEIQEGYKRFDRVIVETLDT